MHRKTLLGLVAGAALVVAGAAAEADTYAIDPTHSNIVFMVEHLGYSKMVGQFQEFSGEIEFDQADVSNSAVAVVIQSASVDTDHEDRDNHLRNADFFNAAEFPEITFTSTAVETSGDRTGRITGDLTMLGVTRPVTLDVTFNQVAPHPLPQYGGVMVAGFSAQAKLNRSDWGMGAFVPNVGDEIAFWIELEAHQK